MELLRLQPLLGKPLVTALTAPPTGRESDCIFNNKPVSSNMFFLLLIFFGFLQQLTWSQYIFFSFFFGGGREIIEINTFIQQGCFKLIKIDDKDICNVTKDFYFR